MKFKVLKTWERSSSIYWGHVYDEAGRAQASIKLTQGNSYLHSKAAGFVYLMKLGAQASINLIQGNG